MRTILITGASGGLAQSMVKLLANDQLILLGRSKKKLEKLYAHLSHVAFFEVDITDGASLKELVTHLYVRYGKIDVLINNAGYGKFEAFDQVSDADIRSMFEVNTFSLMTLSRLVGERMKKAGQGHIVNIVSMAGLIPTSKTSLYAATKFAAEGFSNALRLELLPFGVFVTTVNPGPIETAFFEQADPDGFYQKAVKTYMLKADQVAKKIVQSLGKPKREINLPIVLHLAYKLYTLFPRLGDYLASRLFNYK